MEGCGCVGAFTNCKGDEDVDAKRSRPSIGKPASCHARKERVLVIGTDQRITSGPAATTAASRGRIHGCTRIVSRKVRFFSLAPRAPSIHGTKEGNHHEHKRDISRGLFLNRYF